MQPLEMQLVLKGSPDAMARFLHRSLGSQRFKQRVKTRLKSQSQTLIARQTNAPRRMKLTQPVYQTIYSDLVSLRNEQGAMLLGPAGDDELVDEIILDQWGQGSRYQFEFNEVKLNQILRKAMAEGKDAKGFIHNHPQGINLLSNGDIDYVRSVFTKNAGADWFFMPLFVDGVIEPFIVHRQNPDQPETVDILLVKEKA
ncbi:MAG TPA: hypothetical protein PLN21_02620 [Gemmatales bacterium]|nr:hypothetical protein [Gemmatales bacterium]